MGNNACLTENPWPMTCRDLEWTHYPENDVLPEHFSSVFGLVLSVPGTSRWEAWVLTTVDLVPTCADDIQLKCRLGEDYSVVQTAKRAVLEYVARNMQRGKAAVA